jgi:acyl dehydratase
MTTPFTTDQREREASGGHPYGRYLEEFEVGDVYRHWPAKTVTEADDHLFCLITMNHHPLHINDVYAAGSQQGATSSSGRWCTPWPRHVGVRRVRQGDRQPRHGGAVASGARLPRRHAVRGVRGAREAPVALQARPRHGPRAHPGVQPGRHARAEFKRLVLVPRREAGIKAPEGDVE